jgi:putative endonuclease
MLSAEVPVSRTAVDVGRWGEELAAEHLQRDGACILSRNWRCPAGEIDLIARDAGTVVICEVKTRRSGRFGTPAEAVTAGKLRRLRRLAGLWLMANHPHAAAVRIDVITLLVGRQGAVEVEHLRGVG